MAAGSPPTLLGRLSVLRQLSALTEVSKSVPSRVERGLHEPPDRVPKLIADASNVSAQTLFEHAGLITSTARLNAEASENSICDDRRLTEPRRRGLTAEPCPASTAVTSRCTPKALSPTFGESLVSIQSGVRTVWTERRLNGPSEDWALAWAPADFGSVGHQRWRVRQVAVPRV